MAHQGGLRNLDNHRSQQAWNTKSRSERTGVRGTRQAQKCQRRSRAIKVLSRCKCGAIFTVDSYIGTHSSKFADKLTNVEVLNPQCSALAPIFGN